VSREAKILIGILVVVVGGMVALFVVANKGVTKTAIADPGKLVRADSHRLGNGPVQVVEFGDFQCPACGRLEPAVEQLLSTEQANITLVFRNFPLPQHQNANSAALAAESAGAQGKYWEMHNKLYATQASWSDLADPTPKYIEYATGLGLDLAKFTKSIQDKEFQPAIDTGIADGTALNVNATPTFFINGTAVTTISDYASLKAAVDAALAAKK
jgi:protein-disulfide isomerase